MLLHAYAALLRTVIYKSKRFLYNHNVLRRDRINRLSKEKVRTSIIATTRKAGYKSTGDLLKQPLHRA